jgi:hypothetical protein
MDDVLVTRARRAMELGRMRTALIGSVLVVLGLALLAHFVPSGNIAASMRTGGVDLRWLVLPFAAWTFVAWRGGSLARGGFLGLVAGAAGWLVPMNILRPCCAAMEAASADCCTRPECCLETGIAMGVALALLAPIDLARGRRAFAEQIAGTSLIAASTLGVRCAGLFLGESIGLIGGLAVGAIVASGLRALLPRPLAA